MTIRSNKKNDKNDPPILVKRGRRGTSVRTHRVDICDQHGNVVASVLYTPDRPLSCGAVVYVECAYETREHETTPSRQSCGVEIG